MLCEAYGLDKVRFNAEPLDSPIFKKIKNPIRRSLKYPFEIERDAAALFFAWVSMDLLLPVYPTKSFICWSQKIRVLSIFQAISRIMKQLHEAFQKFWHDFEVSFCTGWKYRNLILDVIAAPIMNVAAPVDDSQKLLGKCLVK